MMTKRVLRLTAAIALAFGVGVLGQAPAHAAEGCHPAYGGCLPITDDLDCGQISAEQKPVTVKVPGVDPYKLDADGDGFGCDDGKGSGGQPGQAPTAEPTKKPKPKKSPKQDDVAAAAGNDDQLPVTGAEVTVLTGLGVAVLLAGAAAVVLVRRRRVRFVAE